MIVALELVTEGAIGGGWLIRNLEVCEEKKIS